MNNSKILKLNILIYLIFLLSALVIFDGVLGGNVISNINYLYGNEPWIYYKKAHQIFSNPILSDGIDWPNTYYLIEQIRNGELPLWAYNEQLGRPGIFIMNNLLVNPIRLLLWISFGVPIGLRISILFLRHSPSVYGGYFNRFFYLIYVLFPGERSISSKLSQNFKNLYLVFSEQMPNSSNYKFRFSLSKK